jgi:hypothetical protein
VDIVIAIIGNDLVIPCLFLMFVIIITCV